MRLLSLLKLANLTSLPAVTVADRGAIAYNTVDDSIYYSDGSTWSQIGSGLVTLTGDVTGSGIGSFATTIGDNKVTNNMLAGSITASKLIGTDIATVGTITSGTWQGTAITDSYIASAATWNAKQDGLSGTGFIKINGTTISYDNNNYLTDISGLSAGGDLTGTYPNPTIKASVSLTTPNIGDATGTSLSLTSSLNEAMGSDIASASSIDIGAITGNYANITGTVAITSLGTANAGIRRTVRFAGALTLTHNATSLILPGAANITTVAGDIATFISLGGGNWQCISYSKRTWTGTGSSVFSVSPTLTGTLTTANITASGTISFTGGTVTLGSSTSNSTIGLGTGATSGTNTKTINIGGAVTVNAIQNINIGSTSLGIQTITIGSTSGTSTINVNGVINVITQTAGDNSTKIASTAYVDTALSTKVTSFTINSANGFSGSVTAGTTPTITLETSITGLLKGDGTAISAANDADVTGKLLTGYVSGAGTISSADSILQGIQKLNGNMNALVTGVSSVNGNTGAVSLTGTSNRITISGANVFDISASYVGQTSITTLGTITTGTLSTGVIVGGVTMTLGSDASYDIYYRNASGILTRLANGTTGQVLTATTGGAPSWAAAAGGVTSVSNSNGTLTISPTTGAVVASLNLGNINTWTGAQTFNSTKFILAGATSGNITISAADTTTSYALKWPSAQGGSNTYLKNDGSGNLTWSTVSIASYTGFVESMNFTDSSVSIANQTYTIDLYANYGYTINTLNIISGGGTCTAALQINGVNVTGISAVSVTTTISSANASAANTVVAGNKITLVITSAVSLTNLQANIKITRT